MSTSTIPTSAAPPSAPSRRADKPAPGSGLDGLVVADTAISEVDGERGQLVVAGHSIEALAGHVPFAAACCLLLDGALPDAAATAAMSRRLGAARQAAAARLGVCGPALQLADPMDALRALLAGHTAPLPPAGEPARSAALRDEAIALLGAAPVYVAAWARAHGKAGQAPGHATHATHAVHAAHELQPDPARDHAADYLRLLGGGDDPARAAALDAYLVTVLEHGMNASTFTARVVASTGSDTVSAVVAALGALKGPLHGGAPGPVLDMLDAIAEPPQAVAWLEAELVAGRRVMGMGHRVYRVRDPRAAVLERAIERLEAAGVRTPRLALARAVERAAEDVLGRRYPDRPLRANVEFYTAVLLDAAGLDRALFTPTFAVGRIAGWCAHVAEQRRTGRLIRPDSRYIGPRTSGA
ncbi:MAG: citrate synthase [Polyangia bacterium]